jgi:hypothetical protein
VGRDRSDRWCREGIPAELVADSDAERPGAQGRVSVRRAEVPWEQATAVLSMSCRQGVTGPEARAQNSYR